MDGLQITIREKSQYETSSAYLDEIKRSVEQQNKTIGEALSKKEAIIAEQKARIEALEAEKKDAERVDTQTTMFETVNDVLFRVNENDAKTNEIIAKLDEFIKRQEIMSRYRWKRINK